MRFEEIQNKFNRVISYSQGVEDPQTDDLFKRWFDAKRDFIEAMDGNLIWEWPEKVSFELGQKEKNLRVNEFCEMIDNKWRNDDLANFIYVQKEGFFSNQVVEEYLSPSGAQIPKGMKLLKAFKFFENDTKTLNDIQSAASMIIQEDKIEGTLCLSVHPLDFLSSSENNHNWRSCHALDGEYRSGNLSHMIDKNTIMCYLKSAREERLPNFPEDVKWNSKKWRVLLFFSDNWDMLFAGRQYPFTTETGLEFVKERVLPVVHMNQWTPWFSKKIRTVEEKGEIFHLNSPYVPVESQLIPMNELVVNEPGSLQFNDLLSSSCYDPLYAFKAEDNWMGKRIRSNRFSFRKMMLPKFKIGGGVKCIKCEKDTIEISSTMMCNSCELIYGNSEDDAFATCGCCGNRFMFDDGIWVDQTQESICPDCADEYTEFCGNCGERYYKSDMVYSRKKDELFCKWCFEDLVVEEEL